jgi:hypothetical protein
MILNYSLIYVQLERCIKMSKMQSGQSYKRRFQTDKVELVREIIVFVTIGIFVALQTVVMALAVDSKVSINTFQIELTVTSSVIIFVLNLSQIIIYFNLAGSPYKNKEYYKKIKHLYLVALIWTVAFIIKFVASFFGADVYNLDITGDGSNFWAACFLAIFTALTEILPLVLIINSNFVKIFSLDHLDTKLTDVENDFLYDEENEEDALIYNEDRMSGKIQSSLLDIKPTENLADSVLSNRDRFNNSPMANSNNSNRDKSFERRLSNSSVTDVDMNAAMDDQISLVVTRYNLNEPLSDDQREKGKQIIEKRMKVSSKDFVNKEPFITEGYPADEK